MPRGGFKPAGASSERLLEFDTCSNPLGHHGRLNYTFLKITFLVDQSTWTTFSFVVLIVQLDRYNSDKVVRVKYSWQNIAIHKQPILEVSFRKHKNIFCGKFVVEKDMRRT